MEPFQARAVVGLVIGNVFPSGNIVHQLGR
jgi:hypothetical protein